MLQFFNGVPFCRGSVRIYTLLNRLNLIPYIIIWYKIHVILMQTVSSNLAIRSVQNSAVELSRRYSVAMKSFRSMHAKNKLYYKGVSEQRIVAWVAKFTGQRV